MTVKETNTIVVELFFSSARGLSVLGGNRTERGLPSDAGPQAVTCTGSVSPAIRQRGPPLGQLQASFHAVAFLPSASGVREAPVPLTKDPEFWSSNWQLQGQNATPINWLVKKNKCGKISLSFLFIHFHVSCLDRLGDGFHV